MARLAILISGLLDPERYGSARLQDLRGRAWSEWGNVLRLQERFRESEQAFNAAEDLLCHGTGDPVERAGLLSLQASMWHDRRQFERAKRLLDRTISIARRVGQRHLHGVALIQKALCYSDQDQPEAALPLLLQAQRLLEPSTEPRLLFVVQQNILVALTKAGRFQEAAAGLDGVRTLCLDRDYPIDLIRLEYVEAMILHGLGRVEKAESRFRSAFHGMLAERLDFDAALVGLDLAALLSEENRHAEVRELAAAMLPVFTSHRIHREAIAALLIFKEAVQREELSAKLVEELSAYLRRAASDPTLRFQPSAWLKGSQT